MCKFWILFVLFTELFAIDASMYIFVYKKDASNIEISRKETGK
jgi:hypothetical protein